MFDSVEAYVEKHCPDMTPERRKILIKLFNAAREELTREQRREEKA